MASNTGRVAVRIPVEAEISNVSKTIEELKRALENVKPETKGYKQIESLLEGAEKKVLQIQKATASGLIDKASLRTLEKNFEDVFSSIEVAAKRLGNVNYENLKIPDSVVQSIKDLEQQMDAAKKAYTKLEGTKLAEVAASSKELGESLNAIGVNFDTDNIDASLDKTEKKITAVREKIDELNESAQRNQLVAQNNRNKKTELQKIKDIFKEGDQGKKARAARTEFFDKNGNFKAGGKDAIEAYLRNFQLDENFIEQVKKLSGSRLSELEEVANNIINKKQKSVDSRATKAQNEADLSGQMAAIQTADLQKLQALRTTLADLKVDPEVQSGFEAMTRELESLRAEVERLKGSAVEASGVGKAASEAVEEVGNAANGVQDKVAGASSELERMTNIGNTVSNMKNAIAQWMGFYQVVNLVKSAVRNIISDIRELDKVMTEIAIVTNMTQKDLWAQMNTYQSIAREYGVSTKGVYEVSQLFYQQGLDSVSVMKLTTETLKMAKIAGLDYSTATDYMTVAIRGFHLEMDQAQNVVDVYSNIASKSASSTTELAEAMSKTASSAAAVGSSFENTTAMIAMMVETTRESASNIGSAMKSIISRYGEMKASPAKLVDSEGEELDFNKVDTALKSVGISMHTAAGQFRDFDDVILELSKKWQTLDINTQRYIATVMAGNRQQSRFLALVSDYDRLSELVEEAANSQDAGTLQTLKTMDSLETKIQNVKTAWQGFYANLGLEDIFKGVLDNITNLLNRLNSMPKVFGKVPALAIALVAKLISVVKSLGTMIITQMAKTWQEVSKIIEDQMANGGKRGAERIKEAVKNNASPEEIAKLQAQHKDATKKKKWSAIGQGLNVAGTALSTYALTLDDSEARKRGGIEIGGGVLSAIGSGLSTGIQSGNVFLGILSGIASGTASVIAGINDLERAEYLEVEAAKKAVEKKKEGVLVAKSEVTSLEAAIKKLKELEEARYDSNEAYQEWLDYKTQIVETYPELLKAYSLEGEAILDLRKGYILLAKKRQEAAQAALEEKQAELDLAVSNSKFVKKYLPDSNQLMVNFGDNLTSNFGDEYGRGLPNITEIRRLSPTQRQIATFSGKVNLTQEEIDTILGLSGYNWGSLKVDSNTINSVIKSKNKDLQQTYASLLFGALYGENGDLFKSDTFTKITGESLETFQSYWTEVEEGRMEINDLTQKYLIAFKKFIESGAALLDNQQAAAENAQKMAALSKSFTSIITNMIGTLDIGDQERLDELAGKASTDKILAQLMAPSLQDSGYDSLEEWQASGEESFALKAQQYIKELLRFYNSIGDEQYDSIISFISHPEKFTTKENYKSELQNILNKFNVRGQFANAFFELADASWQDISESAQQNFQDMMTGNMNNAKTPDISEIAACFSDLVYGIVPELLPKLISQWGEMVNQAGTTVEAEKNAEFLFGTYSGIRELADTAGEEASQVVQGILANATLSTREGLQAAIDAIKNYAKENGLTENEEIKAILSQLEQQRKSLAINLNTELQSYISSLNEATKNVANAYKIQGSGFDDFDSMQKALTTINDSRSEGEKLDLFGDNGAFEWSTTLGKWIYSTKGLLAATQNSFKTINDSYQEMIGEVQQREREIEKVTGLWHNDFSNLEAAETNLGGREQLIKILNQQLLGFSEGDTKTGLAEFIKILETGIPISEAWELFINSAEGKKEEAEQYKIVAEKMAYEAQQLSAVRAIDFSSIIKGDITPKIQQSINTWFTSLLDTEKGLGIIAEVLHEDIDTNDISGTKEKLKNRGEDFFNNVIQQLGNGTEERFKLLQLALEDDFDYDTAVSWYNAKIKASYDLLASAFDKAPQEIIQLTEEQARFLENESIAISNNEGIKTVTVQTLIDSADRLWGTIEAAFQAGIISLDSYINAYKNNHIPLGLKNTRSIISNLNSYSIGTNITDLKIGEELETLGYNLEKVRDAADNIIGYYIIDIPNNLREAYNQLYEDIVANGGTQSEQNDAWAKMMTANSASDTLDLISSAQKLTYEKFAEAANNAGKDAAALYQRYLNEGIIRIVNGQIQVVKINEFLEGMDINPASAEYKQSVDEFNQAMASNYATLIKTNNRAAINAINAIGKTSLTIDDFAQLFGSEEEIAEVFDKQGNIINKKWQKAIKRIGPNSYEVINFDEYINLINQSLQEAGKAVIEKNSQEYLNSYKNWVNNQSSKYNFSGFEGFYTEFKELTYSQLEAFAESIGRTVQEVEAAATKNSDDSYDVTNILKAEGLVAMLDLPLEVIKTALDDGDRIAEQITTFVQGLSKEQAIEVSKVANEALSKLFKRTTKEIQKDLETLSKGTKKFATLSDIKDFNKTLSYLQLNLDQIGGEGADIDWDAAARSYVLTTKGLATTIYNYSAELYNSVLKENAGKEEAAQLAREEVTRQLSAMVSEAANNINIGQYISSGKMASDIKTITTAYDQFKVIVEAMGAQISMTAQQFVTILDRGGENAVRLAKAVATATGSGLTYKTATDAYRSNITVFEDAIAQLEYGVGAVVNDKVTQILTDAGYTFKSIIIQEADEEHGIQEKSIAVIQTVGDLNKAYQLILDQMANTAGVTLAELNEYAVTLIQSTKVNEAAAIVSNAASQSLESFGKTLEKKGIQLAKVWEDWVNSGIISYDGSNVHVLDLQAYFKALGIEITDQIMSNPAYVAGLNAFNEEFLELNRAAETRIVEEVKKVSQASAGDRVNLTYFNSVLNKLTDEQQEVLIQELERSGAVLQDGILYISDNADTLGISVAIGRAANQTGLLLASEIAQVGDSVNNALKNYVQILNNGIQGTLSNEDANTLRQYAESLGIELDFTRTEEGLKLSVNSATQLVAKLREVDAYAAKTSFKALKDSIKASNDGCQTLEETLRTIAELEAQMNKNPGNDAVRERLELYRQIRDEQMDDPNSYNFMSRALPNGMQGAENYWNSWGTAFKAMNEAATTGYIGIQDFYNIVNEMNYIAGKSGQTIDFMGYSLNGELTNMASLIQEGMSAIKNVDGEGAKIDLSGFSTSLLAGAEGMEDGVEEGIKAFARAQIKILDAAIQMLEGIVALQELGKVDVDKDGIFSMKDVFKWDNNNDQAIAEFTEQFDEARKAIIEQAKNNAALNAALNSFKINIGEKTYSIAQMLTMSAGELKDAGLTLEQQFAFFNSMKNINFANSDFASIDQAIQEALTGAFQGAEVTLGEDGSITVVIGAKDIQTEVTDGAEAAVIDETKEALKRQERLEVAARATDTGINTLGTMKKSLDDLVEDFLKNGATDEELINQLEVTLNGIKVLVNKDNVDVSGIVEVIREALNEAFNDMQTAAENSENQESGYTAPVTISTVDPTILPEALTTLGAALAAEGGIKSQIDSAIDSSLSSEQAHAVVTSATVDSNGVPLVPDTSGIQFDDVTKAYDKTVYAEFNSNQKAQFKIGSESTDETASNESNQISVDDSGISFNDINKPYDGTINATLKDKVAQLIFNTSEDNENETTTSNKIEVQSDGITFGDISKDYNGKITANYTGGTNPAQLVNVPSEIPVSTSGVVFGAATADLATLKLSYQEAKDDTAGTTVTLENAASVTITDPIDGATGKVNSITIGPATENSTEIAGALAAGKTVKLTFNDGDVGGEATVTITPITNETTGANAELEGTLTATPSDGQVHITGYRIDLTQNGQTQSAVIPNGELDIETLGGLLKKDTHNNYSLDTSVAAELNVTTTADQIAEHVGTVNLNTNLKPNHQNNFSTIPNGIQAIEVNGQRKYYSSNGDEITSKEVINLLGHYQAIMEQVNNSFLDPIGAIALYLGEHFDNFIPGQLIEWLNGWSREAGYHGSFENPQSPQPQPTPPQNLSTPTPPPQQQPTSSQNLPVSTPSPQPTSSQNLPAPIPSPQPQPTLPQNLPAPTPSPQSNIEERVEEVIEEQNNTNETEERIEEAIEEQNNNNETENQSSEGQVFTDEQLGALFASLEEKAGNNTTHSTIDLTGEPPITIEPVEPLNNNTEQSSQEDNKPEEKEEEENTQYEFPTVVEKRSSSNFLMDLALDAITGLANLFFGHPDRVEIPQEKNEQQQEQEALSQNTEETTTEEDEAQEVSTEILEQAQETANNNNEVIREEAVELQSTVDNAAQAVTESLQENQQASESQAEATQSVIEQTAQEASTESSTDSQASRDNEIFLRIKGLISKGDWDGTGLLDILQRYVQQNIQQFGIQEANALSTINEQKLDQGGSLTFEEFQQLVNELGVSIEEIITSLREDYGEALEPEPSNAKGTNEVELQLTANSEEANQAIQDTRAMVEENNATLTVDGNTEPVETRTQATRASIANNPATLTVNTRVNRESVDQLMYDLRNLDSIAVNPKTGTPLVGTTIAASATGNVALAGGRGTLMGELGPELYVTNGHYYVAGQNGAEFVNLPDDAIVFNHLQTQRLLENGHAGRGRVVTNERKATSLATGNMSGPAMASAAAVLAQLKQIRALWDAMLKAPLSDFGSKAGTGKKGGGGGGSKNKDKTDNNSANLDSGYIKDLERWYNLLRKIEKLEQDISYEEKLRSKLQADSVSNGKLIYESYRRSYEALQKEVDNRVKLAELKKGYYEQQMEELKNSKWADFFYFDDEGTIQRKTSGSEFLANLYATNVNGGAIHSAREQYQMLLNAGYGSLMEYKEDGSKIEWTDSSGKAREDAYAEAVKAFSSKIDSQTEAYESLREDYMNEMESILDAQTKQNEILTAIRENTIAVEQEVLDAILSAREREIEELQNQRDALQDSSDKFINGLTDELNKERDMYNQQQEDKELAQLYRQLGILQRSGASASQIRSIQDQISQKEQDAYFEGQQKQIDAIKEASDLQLERLDAQISLMSETLEYQKAHGLLWDQVYQVMSLSESEIADFIMGKNDAWWANSAEKTRLDMVELGNKIQQWTAYRDDISDTKNAITNAINNGIAAITNVVARVSTPNVYTATGDGGYIPSTGTSSDGTTGSSGGGTGSTSGKTGGKGGKTGTTTTTTTTASPKQKVVYYYNLAPHYTFDSQGEATSFKTRQISQAQKNNDTEAYDMWKNHASLRSKVVQFKKGGLIDYTGPAWVDGTKKKPEGILNAEQLDMLRNSVLTRKNPVAALLADYQGIVSDTAGSSAYNSINQNNGVNVERIELNMNVSKMSNDYDARRAADTMMDEVIRIARKSGATSVSRR